MITRESQSNIETAIPNLHRVIGSYLFLGSYFGLSMLIRLFPWLYQRVRAIHC